MKKIEINHPDQKINTGAYSAGVEVDGWVFISGQGPIDVKTGKEVNGTVEEETRLTLQHIGKILAANGCDFSNVVKCVCHLKEIRDFDRFNKTYAEFFSGVLPARTTVQSVLCGNIKVEIDAIARKESKLSSSNSHP